MKSKCLKTCNVVEADEARLFLAEHGIRAVIVPHSESALATITGGGGAVDLLVLTDDVPQARALLGLDQPQSQSLEALSERVLSGLRRGQSQAEMVQWLMEHGWPEAGARRLVADKARQLNFRGNAPQASQEADRIARRRMFSGLGWLVAGIILTIGSHLLASDGGGIQFIWWGAIVWGLIDFVAGLTEWLKHR